MRLDGLYLRDYCPNDHRYLTFSGFVRKIIFRRPTYEHGQRSKNRLPERLGKGSLFPFLDKSFSGI